MVLTVLMVMLLLMMTTMTWLLQAFLGYENRYVFDRERQMWVLEDELAPLQQQQQPQPPPQPQQPTQAPQPHHPSTHYQVSRDRHLPSS